MMRTRCTIFRTSLVAFTAVCVCPRGGASPVDLSPPRNALGYADDQGYFRMVQRFGDITFTGGFELPLRFDFWSGRLGTVGGVGGSSFGWQGWHCGPLEARAEYFGDRKQVLRVTLLCAKQLHLAAVPGEPGRYRDASGAWTGTVEGDALSVARADGWDLRFEKNLVASLRTDTGLTIHWERDAAGHLLRVREAGREKDPVRVEVVWKDGKPASGQVEKIILPGNELRFVQESATGLLREISWGSPLARHRLDLAQDATSLRVVGADETIRKFTWKPDTLALESDGWNTYRISVNARADDPAAAAKPRTVIMRTGEGREIVRQVDTTTGLVQLVDESGARTVTKLVPDGAAAGLVQQVDHLLEKGRVITVMRNEYDDGGRLIRRHWLGNPVRFEGFSSGQLESSLMADPNQGYEGARFSGEAGPMTVIDFEHDAEGRQTGARIGGKAIWSRTYDDQGRLLRMEVFGRFRQENRFAVDGGRESVLSIPGITDRPASWVTAEDPVVTPELVVSEKVRPDGRPMERILLDGRIKRFSYDPAGRRIRDEVLAPDGKTRLTESNYVHGTADAPEVLVIEENFATGVRANRVLSRGEAGRILARTGLSDSQRNLWLRDNHTSLNHSEPH